MGRHHEEREPPPEPNGRITHRDVYEMVRDLRNEVSDNFVSKAELRMWVVLGLVGGQGVTAIVTQLATGMKPVTQAAWIVARVRGLV